MHSVKREYCCHYTRPEYKQAQQQLKERMKEMEMAIILQLGINSELGMDGGLSQISAPLFHSHHSPSGWMAEMIRRCLS
jgi:hypothetical protein